MIEIKISELSIGDWVMNIYANKPSRVIGLRTMFQDTYEIIAVSDDTQYMLIEDNEELHNFEPIRLTPEILGKNGFRLVVVNKKFNDWLDNNITIRKYYNEDNYHLFVCGQKIEFKMIFVHQLQHALRLAGVEKEIEL